MSLRWLKREGPGWVARGLIDQGQWEGILRLYARREAPRRLLPLLAGVLVAFGVLSLVALHWEEIPDWLRVLLIVTAMTSFYGAGEWLVRKGSPVWGVSLTGIGLACFGGGMILLAQMFHFVSYDATLFIVWGLAGTALLYIQRSRFLFLLAAAILTAGQVYDFAAFGAASETLLVLFVAVLGFYWLQSGIAWLTWVYGIGAAIHLYVLLLHIHAQVEVADVAAAAVAVLLLHDVLKEREFLRPLRIMALTAGYLTVLDLLLFRHTAAVQDRMADEWVLLFLLVAGVLLRVRQGSRSFSDFLLFLPPLFLPLRPDGALFAGLGALLAHNCLTLYQGNREHIRWQVYGSLFLFAMNVVLGYAMLPVSLLAKALFFFGAGLALYGVSRFAKGRESE
jgi:uncharacterized membrane protein